MTELNIYREIPEEQNIFDQFKHQNFGGILQQPVIFDSSVFGCLIQSSLIFQRLYYVQLFVRQAPLQCYKCNISE